MKKSIKKPSPNEGYDLKSTSNSIVNAISGMNEEELCVNVFV